MGKYLGVGVCGHGHGVAREVISLDLGLRGLLAKTEYLLFTYKSIPAYVSSRPS